MLDNSTYFILIYNTKTSRCGNNKIIEIKPVYPKNTSELQMSTWTDCMDSRSFNNTDDWNLEGKYTSQ